MCSRRRLGCCGVHVGQQQPLYATLEPTPLSLAHPATANAQHQTTHCKLQWAAWFMVGPRIRPEGLRPRRSYGPVLPHMCTFRDGWACRRRLDRSNPADYTSAPAVYARECANYPALSGVYSPVLADYAGTAAPNKGFQPVWAPARQYKRGPPCAVLAPLSLPPHQRSPASSALASSSKPSSKLGARPGTAWRLLLCPGCVCVCAPCDSRAREAAGLQVRVSLPCP